MIPVSRDELTEMCDALESIPDGMHVSEVPNYVKNTLINRGQCDEGRAIREGHRVNRNRVCRCSARR